MVPRHPRGIAGYDVEPSKAITGNSDDRTLRAALTSRHMPQDRPEQDQVQAPLHQVTFKEFLEKVPPGRTVSVKSFAVKTRSGTQGNVWYPLTLPLLELHCDTDSSCGGMRLFEPKGGYSTRPGATNIFVSFVCRNCKTSEKTYALMVYLTDQDKGDGELFKYGEDPHFGSPTPARVVSLIGPEKEYYFKGRRSENQGLGIAAFAYYRRVVENQKNRMLDEIIRVAAKIGASQEMLRDLETAKTETQFTTAVKAMKHGIPPALMINGHNPLTLLHAALSEGLHAQTDEDCLAVATSIRVVLTDFAERLGSALKDNAELNAAVSRLMKPFGGD